MQYTELTCTDYRPTLLGRQWINRIMIHDSNVDDNNEISISAPGVPVYIVFTIILDPEASINSIHQ